MVNIDIYVDVLHLTTDAVVPREEQAAGHEDEEDDEDGDTDCPEQVLVTRRLLHTVRRWCWVLCD